MRTVTLTAEQRELLRDEAITAAGDPDDIAKNVHDGDWADARRMLRRWERIVRLLEQLDQGAIVVDDGIRCLIEEDIQPGLHGLLADEREGLHDPPSPYEPGETRELAVRRRRRSIDNTLDRLHVCHFVLNEKAGGE